eukprot:CAMPEP_0181216020 /NCGR_PEP_ID=MMETSP1096-20121128/26345_1 /TAXON_ID=156174 ORGANISM="Chrysochromulina ericina, Strain CCMP281" /NCGR_SAMPLE_ID=MMETSP1096 /ASSEMBLY_ACC=CAM_ASM_000453 /LENGTH=198 /DNA_ID=CAMNT_0023307957 /DNA_START=101 /DNA_END=698 /DNA_ORIENTATION=+
MSSPDTDMLATRPVAERKVVAMSESMRLITAPPPYALYQARVASPAIQFAAGMSRALIASALAQNGPAQSTLPRAAYSLRLSTSTQPVERLAAEIKNSSRLDLKRLTSSCNQGETSCSVEGVILMLDKRLGDESRESHPIACTEGARTTQAAGIRVDVGADDSIDLARVARHINDLPEDDVCRRINVLDRCRAPEAVW